jgi:hypothetical protein
MAALLICGCGGGESGGGVSKASFVARAESVCSRDYERTKVGYQSFVGRAKGKPFSTEAEIEGFADTVLVPSKRREVEELRSLGVPSGDEDEVDAILGAYEEGIAVAEEDPRAAVLSTSGVFVEATELAEAYGLEKCRY